MTVPDVDALTGGDVVRTLIASAVGDCRWIGAKAELITGGKSNLTYLLTSPAGELVLRRPPSGAVLATAHDMQREARVQQALQGSAVPVARVVLVDDGEAIGVPFYVMERVPGLVVRDTLPAGLAGAPDKCRALGLALVDTLAAVHMIEPQAVGLEGYGRPDGFVERQVRRWRGQWDAARDVLAAPEQGAAVDELFGRLEGHIPASPAAGLVHGDYRLDNCIVDAVGLTRINAVLDWELSTLGDPLTDLGMLLFYWHDAARLVPTVVQSVTDAEGFPSPDEITQRWSTLTGMNVDAIGWYNAFAHAKFAAITAGIGSRVRAGAMSGQDFGDLSASVEATGLAGLAAIAG